ncbi:hypothetical protein [Geomicrobium sediminis]|uniref:ABC transporter permease n=1 Tax=Geomicrobium sediminis TaxID=1347788 RepID=A0ABS2PAL6_9BACL|nr:hypothetical protein [Geomicrobium sediminis]MBM7632176.1 hypothetical protein [Geomicrobium sediminis]
MNFLQLLFIEFNRMKWFLLMLVIVVFGAQFFLSMITPGRLVRDIQLDRISAYETYNFSIVLASDYYLFTVLIPTIVIFVYVAIIWYRDWLGKGTYMQRLLTLPIRRMIIFYAKLTTIVLVALLFIALHSLLLPLQQLTFAAMLPDQFYSGNANVITLIQMSFLEVFYWHNLIDFIYVFLISITLISLMFTGVLIERAYRYVGLVMNASIVIVLFVLYIQLIEASMSFYSHEMMWMISGIIVILLTVSLVVSSLLLTKRMSA